MATVRESWIKHRKALTTTVSVSSCWCAAIICISLSFDNRRCPNNKSHAWVKVTLCNNQLSPKHSILTAKDVEIEKTLTWFWFSTMSSWSSNYKAYIQTLIQQIEEFSKSHIKNLVFVKHVRRLWSRSRASLLAELHRTSKDTQGCHKFCVYLILYAQTSFDCQNLRCSHMLHKVVSSSTWVKKHTKNQCSRVMPSQA